MAKDLYGVLGLQKGASPEEMKSAYRRLSKEWHPDKHKGDKGAETKFKEINEAYETLSDPKKKQMYDQFGTTGNGQGGGGGNAGGFDFNNFADGFSGFGDLGDIFGNFFTGARQQRQQPGAGEDIAIEVTVSFADLVSGVKREVMLNRFIACHTCHGNGAEPGSKTIQCKTCGGTGQITSSVNSFFGRIQQRVICDVCSGSGTVPEKPCHTCKGEGRLSSRDRIVIDIPAGIDEGQSLRMSGQGHAGLRGAPAGDLFVRIRIQQDPRFIREGTHVRSSVSISVLDAMLGGTVNVDTVQGTSTLNIPEGTQPGQVLRIKGKGFPELGTSRFGDHYVTINVEIPKKLSRAERKIVEEWREIKN